MTPKRPDPGHDPRITVVNDSPEFLELMDAMLEEDSGYDVTTIDADEITDLEPIRRSRPDLLIIDLRLRPDGMAGWDILLAVRQDPELDQLPVILCSGDVESLKVRKEAINKDPMVATLQKPFHLDELEELVRRFVGGATSA
jgi:CheY-like chemotaxis protein